MCLIRGKPHTKQHSTVYCPLFPYALQRLMMVACSHLIFELPFSLIQDIQKLFNVFFYPCKPQISATLVLNKGSWSLLSL